MPAKDTYHDTVRDALVKDGWTITDDPLRLVWGKKDVYIDLGAERMLGAEKQGRQIAVEVKSFMGASQVNDIENALGQFLLYHSIMRRKEPDRALFLAVPKDAAKVSPGNRLRPGKGGDHSMDTLNKYGDVVERVLEVYATIPYSHGDLACEAVFDRQRGRFVLMTVGWDDGERIHHPVIHIDIVGGKLWIQTNNTDCDVAAELVAAGVPKSDIVLAFRPPEVRRHTEYAVA